MQSLRHQRGWYRKPMAPSPKQQPGKQAKSQGAQPEPSVTVSPATRRLNTSAAEPSTAAERPVSSEAEQPAPRIRQRRNSGKPELLGSKLAYQGKVFSVYTDTLIEPGDTKPRDKDVIRHNGSVVILAIDETKNRELGTGPKDPAVILIRQYRHAAGQFLLELPAGRIEPDERPLAAAKREMIEETGIRAKRWTLLTRYFASPGFLGEWMQIYLAQELEHGVATPEEDEHIELLPTPLSKVLELIADNKLHDGKTIIGVSLLAQRRRAGTL